MKGDVILMATVGILPYEFAIKDNQPLQLEGDVLAEKTV